MYGNLNEKQAITQELLKFRQKGFVINYASRFKQFAVKTRQQNNDILIDTFYKGLKNFVKDEIIRKKRPVRFNEYINKAIKIDNC